ncbi:hypothetical protein [Turicibacter bilis]|uniref:hypothetical protein n=1 Tax=Turicibacter bilis TaxID=2735723 RepID=UPI003F8B4F24
MKKKLLLTLLLPTILVGCSTKNDLPIEESQGASTDNTEIIEVENSDLVETEGIYKEYTLPIELKLFKELGGNEVIHLSDNRFFVENGEKTTIYDEDFDIVKEVGEIKYSGDVACYGVDIACDGVFAFEEPFFTDGEMKSKIGLMDFDGNIISEAGTISEDSYDDEFFLYFIDDSIYPSDAKQEFLGLKDEGGKFGLSRLLVDNDSFEVLKVLVEPKYDELKLSTYSCLTTGCEYDEVTEDDLNRQSVAFKSDSKWGIVDFEGNHVLEAEYGDVNHLEYNEEDNLDYYQVINESGKAGVYSTKNGWIIEPTFSYEDKITMINSNIIVKSSTSDLTTIYDINGNVVKEIEANIKISGIEDLSNNKGNSFYESKYIDFDVAPGLFDSNFNEIYLEYGNYHEYHATIADKAIIGCNGDVCELYTIDGMFVTELPCNDISDIAVVNEKYLLIGTTVYELVEL